jgi:hypothetical protein
MEVKELNKTDFAVIAKKNGNETRQFVFEDNAWYEQLTVDDVQYRHKLLSVKLLSKDGLDKKAEEIQPGTLPICIRSYGEVMAFVCSGKTAVYYHLPLGTKKWKARAKQVVFNYAKSLITPSAEGLKQDNDSTTLSQPL